MKTIHFFDLDGTLWNVDGNAWIINKNKPSKPIIKLSKIQLNDILSGIHKKDEIMIDYNGKNYWISENMFNKIKKRYPNITEDKLGISFIEMTDSYNFDKLSIFKENIRHLINKDGFDIGILSARYNEENDKMLLSSLKKELDNIGLYINKFHYVGDFFRNKINDNIAYRKSDVLLEYLIGFKIKNDKFLPIMVDKYDVVYFYDDEFKNIQVANEIQILLEEYLRNTDDEVFNKIMKLLETSKPILYTNLITNNSLNRFRSNKVELKKPIKYPVKIEENYNILKFDEFKKK